MQRRTRAKYVFEYLLLPLFATAVAVLFLESWSGRRPFELVPAWETMAPWALAANILLLWMIAVFVAAITVRPRLALLGTLDVYLLLFLLHAWKMEHLETPLMVTDAFGWKEAMLAGFWLLSAGDWALLAGLIVVPFLTLAFPIIFPPFPGTRLFHLGLTALTVSFFGTFVTPERTWTPWLEPLGRVDRSRTPLAEAREQGLLWTQAVTWPRLRLGAPAVYDRAAVANVLRPFAAPETAAFVDEPVDVVVYAIEGFSDPMRWQTPPEQDPLVAFRAHAAEHSSGSLSVPVSGGDTGQVELELLTGFSSALLPIPTVPFQRYVHRTLHALPRVFADYGYRSIAIHSEPARVLSRGLVFPRLGFTDYRSLEKLPRSGPAHDDEQVVDAILEELAPAAAHFTLAVTRAPANAADRETYLEGLRRSDAALGRLLESLRARSRPTMVVAFGTYVPALVSRERLVVDRESAFRTPLLLWTNFPRSREALDENVLFLGARLLQWAGVPPTPWYRFLTAASEKIAVLRPDELRDRFGGVFPADGQRWQVGAQEVFPWVRSHWLLQYDQLFGAGYAVPPPEDVKARLPPTPKPSGMRVVTGEPETPDPTPAPMSAPSAGKR
jgi:hypothetical protein